MINLNRGLALFCAQRVVGDIMGVSQSTACDVIHRVSLLLAQTCHEHIHFPAMQEKNKRLFANIAGLPGIVGCVDGCHVRIDNPGGENAEVSLFFRVRFQLSS